MRNLPDGAGREAKRAMVIGFLLVAGLVLVGCSGDDSPSSASVGGRRLATRSVTVGSVDVSVTPTSVSDKEARFAVALDTHSGDLSTDLERSTSLAIAGQDWRVGKVSGDGPGGHHREVTVRFEAGGPARGVMRFTIDGLARPVSFTWRLS